MQKAGTLKSIELINFMCHEHFQIDFNDRINYIVGSNGSGKSAILVAISICLGGRVSFTNRGRKISDIIMNGKEFSKIIIILKNSGDDEYKRDIYGDLIKIERLIKKNGSSQYKIYGNKRGHFEFITNKTSDLRIIKDHLKIEIDNPCVLLMQDTSKTFLTNTSSKKKYEFFLESIGTKTLERFTKEAVQNLEHSEKLIKEKKEILDELGNEVKMLGVKLERSRNLNELKESLKHCEAEKMWIKYNKELAVFEQLQQEYNEKEQEYKQFTKKQLVKEKEEKEEEYKKQESKCVNISNELEGLKAERNKINKKVDDKDDEINESNSNLSEIQKDQENNNRRIQLLNENIEKTKMADEKEIEEKKREKENNIKEFEKEITHIETEINGLNEQKEMYQNQLKNQKEMLANIDNEESGYKQTIKELDKEIRKLEEANDSLSKYGQKVVQLMEEIRNNTFKQEVIGPIGEYIQLLKPEYNVSLELSINKLTLSGFIVQCKEDSTKMLSILKKLNFTNCNIFLYTKKLHRYNVQHILPHSLLSFVKIENDLVFNALIDHASVDRIGLTDNRKDSYSKLTKTCRDIYVKENNNYYHLFLRNDTNGTELLRAPQRPLFSSKNVNEMIEQLKNELETNKSSLQEIVNQQKEKKQMIQETNMNINKINTEIRNQTRLKRIKEGKKKEEEERVIKEPESIEELKDRLNKEEKRQRDYKEREEEERNHLNKLTEEKEELKQQLDKLNEQIDDKSRNERDKEHMVLKQISEEIENIEEKIKNLRGKKEEVKKKMNEVHAKLEEEEKRKKQMEEEALKYEKVESDRPLEDVENDITVKRTQIEELEKEEVSSVDIEELYKKKSEELKKTKEQIEKITKLKKGQHLSSADRKKLYDRLLKESKNVIEKLFEQYSEKKPNYKGRVDIDTIKGELTMYFSINSKKERDIQTLSGGEKSFATVCLLMSLWNRIDCPFRAMDEFDVFMDSVSRRTAIEALTDISLDNETKRQYIYITPHNLDGVEENENIKVVKMEKKK